MDDWSKQLWQAVGSAMEDLSQHIAHDTERWLHDLGDRLEEASEAVLQTTDQWAEQVQATLDPQIDRLVEDVNRTLEPLTESLSDRLEAVAAQLDQVMDPVVGNLAGLDQWLEEISTPLTSTVEPLLQNYPACVGCRHFYGQAHGGNTLVCAMHPFGPEDKTCSDWEAIWPRTPNSSQG